MSGSQKPRAQSNFWHTCLTECHVNSSDEDGGGGDDGDEYVIWVSVLQRNRANYICESTEAYRSDAGYPNLTCGSHSAIWEKPRGYKYIHREFWKTSWRRCSKLRFGLMNLEFIIHDRGKGILSEAAALQSKRKKNGMRVGGELGSLGSGHETPEYDRILDCGQQRLKEAVKWG